MAGSRRGIVALFVVLALMIYAVHTYGRRQAYKAGVYIGTAAFTTQDFQNRQCRSIRGASLRGSCRVVDLNAESAVEEAGFRDGWRQARTAALGGR